FTLAGGQHQLSGSVGITAFPDDGDDVQTLLKNADIAMYKAKQGGKNRYQFYARHMQVDAQARMQMEKELRAAVDNQEFVLHYQPIVDADSGELVGAEALIRWPRPDGSMASPLDFVPVAEDCGLIVPIGEWVLREAARQWHEWQRKDYPPLHLSVNVSGVQFREPSLNQRVEEILAEFAIAPGYLVLEITESVLMDGSLEAENRMKDIKALGVGYSLDDFGTGFSSLSYLKRFPVDIVKIDRSFVNDCPDDHNDAHLVEAIVNMAHSLDLRVTAEGVETEEQLEFLRDLGCDYLQGFLVGRPLPAAAFEVLIQRRQLLLPTDGASFEESRFLAALRQDELDVDAWLTRLLGERSPELLEFVTRHQWVSRGLDLRHAVQAHLDWRRRLDDFIGAGSAGATMSVDDAGTAECCPLGHWISQHLAGGTAGFAALDRAHRNFHRLAGQIVSDHQHGHRSLARRALTGVAFRKASRDVITALIDCYREEGTAADKVF
ncbi:MAG TPA: EAL domain-containing protein, partial [Rhodocyclaceae bacterium]|nr:EAL domain-containing protein [Rhodocyclaceae bacterium]